MTKIRDMATIRPLKKATSMRITTPTAAPNAVPHQLRDQIAKKQKAAAQFHEVVLMAIEDLAHPVTVAEVQKHVGIELNKEFNQPRIRSAFDALLSSGRLVSRLETDQERIIRFGDATPIAGKAMLYYPTSLGSEVPARTKYQVVEGSGLVGRGNWSTGSKRAKSNKAAKVEKAARGINPPAGSLAGILNKEALDFMIEKIVEARHAELIQELAETKSQLEKIKSLLK